MSARDYDVVLYGAGGFTGRQTVAYFARHAPPQIRWAIAGRTREKLEAVRAEVGAPARPEDVLVADSQDQAAVDAVVSRTRIVLSTAGPFARYGTPIVDACVRFGTDYVDITGETAWVRQLIDRYHDRAAAGATRIITCCGFDSVPADLGTFLLVRHMQRAGIACSEVRAFYTMSRGLNGGTVASILNATKDGSLAAMDDVFLLDPSRPDSPRQIEHSQDITAPRFDPEIGTWSGPFVMAPTNTRIVRRSVALYADRREPYGDEFVYQEYQRYDPPLARAKAVAVTAGLSLFRAALGWPPARRVIEPTLPRPGTGPSVRTMDEGWFRCELIGFAHDGRRVRGLILHKGDPGNRATVRFVCESALALALDGDRLPGGPSRGGVLTPATGLGQVLAERLRNAGVRIDIGSQS